MRRVRRPPRTRTTAAPGLLTALLGLGTLALSAAIGQAQSLPTPGDGLYKPEIHPVAAIDKRADPITLDLTQPEPRFAPLMSAGTPTGDSYVIHFSTGDVGGPCTYTGKARYLAESTGALKFELLASCGKLQRGYSYTVCMLSEELRCAEAPWWYFTGRTYRLTSQGLLIDGSRLYPWRDGEGPQKVAATAARISAFRARYVTGAANTVHGRSIACRSYDPATRQTTLHDFSTTCAVRTLCSGMPDLGAVKDGALIEPASPAERYVQKQSSGKDISGWVCWARSY